jgi:1D-myo-inositol-tetrakisphosphate 5-kinase/inositol-polyphosphate multikinase
VYDGNKEVYEVTPKSYGKSIKASELPAGMAKFFPTVGEDGTGPGVRKDLLVPVVKGVLEDVQEVRKVIAQTEMRMVAGSLLIVWEGDEATLEAALDKKVDDAQMNSEPTSVVDSDVTSEVDGLAGGGASGVSSEYGYGAGRRVGPPHVVRVIDFAHTHAVPGLGPDEGVLKGIDTVLSLLRGRRAELEA